MTASELPLVTVVMPVRNESGVITSSLRSVLDQDYPPDKLEILVVDGCSDDDTVAEVEALRAGLRPGSARVEVLVNERRTAPVAMNLGLERAAGSVVLLVGGHSELSPDYVAVCVEVLRRSEEVACVGGVLEAVGHGLTGRAVAAAQSSGFGAGGAAFRQGAAGARAVDTVAFGAYRRAVFDQVGPFDAELTRNQDDEMSLRLTRAGWTIWLDPSISARYHVRSSLRHLARQYFQYGLFKARVAQKHRGIGTARQMVPSAFVLALGAASVAAVTGRRRPAAALLTAYGVASAAASVRAAPGPAVATRLPAVYAVMHVAYGTGYLVGVPYWLVTAGDRDWGLSR